MTRGDITLARKTAAPDPSVLHPITGQDRVVLLGPLVKDPRIEVADYTYYDDLDDPLAFERDAFLYAYGPERLVIGRYCAIASGVRLVMPRDHVRRPGRAGAFAAEHGLLR